MEKICEECGAKFEAQEREEIFCQECWEKLMEDQLEGEGK